MDTLYIVIPAYNEEENIGKCVSDWYGIVQKHSGNNLSRLIVINDGSKDSTYCKLLELSKNYPLLIPLTKTNEGHGPTVLYAYRYAIDQGADWIFQTDSDGQTDPDEFEMFWEQRINYDAIIGWRAVRGDGKYRKFVENIVCLLLRLIFGVGLKDANAPFRLMKSELLQKYIDKIPKDYNLPNIILTTFFVYYKEEVLFLPITFKPRVKGTNSINLKKIFKIGWNAIGDFNNFKKKMK